MDDKITVLVVDDSRGIRNILDKNLQLDGFDVYLAEDGRIGLETARTIKPDLILLDWEMPEMDGMETLAELKSDEQTKDIPVFMLTSKSTTSDVGMAICEGAEGYFPKPFDPTKLGKVLKLKLQKLVTN